MRDDVFAETWINGIKTTITSQANEDVVIRDTAHDIRESLTPKLHALRYDQCGYVVPLRRIFKVQPNSFSNSDLFIRLILSSIGSHLLTSTIIFRKTSCHYTAQ